jgi:hypothetical protein
MARLVQWAAILPQLAGSLRHALPPCFPSNIMSVSEIIGTIHDGNTQVCATAEADYDHAAQKVLVSLCAFTRRAAVSHDGAPVPPSWLPPPERVCEHLPRSEADAFVKDVFHSWVKKVRASIPANLPLRA